VSDASVQTRVEQSAIPRPTYSSQPYNDISSQPLGGGSISDGIASVKLRPVKPRSQLPDLPEEEALKEVSKLIVGRRDDQKYVPEMVDTLKRRKQIIGMRRIDSVRGLTITKSSTPKQVQSWLQEKGFSDYTQSVLQECAGEDLFRMSKDELKRFCGEEGSRLNSLILVQKKRSHYDTGSELQLRALLDMRKEYVESHNDGAIEPDTPAPAATVPPPEEPKPTTTTPTVAPSIANHRPSIATVAQSVRSYR
jgi:hypothetical protein